MSKAKSTVITVLLALAIAVAAFFAVISFPVSNNVKRLNSVASMINLGADFSGYAYTTVYPEGVITLEEYGVLTDEEKGAYVKVDGSDLFVEKETHPDVDELKEAVAKDASSLNARFGKKGYSSYSVAVEGGVSVKISVPTNFSRSAYKGYDASSRSTALSTASAALSSITAYGQLTLRTTDTSINLTDASGNSSTWDLTKKGKDKWVESATVSGSKTYSLTEDDDVSEYFSSITSRKVGSVATITFNLTKAGKEWFKDLTTRVLSSSSKTIYFFVGDRQLVSFGFSDGDSPINRRSITLQSSDPATAQNSAITMNSAVNGGALSLNYRDIETIKTSTASLGEESSLFLFVASIIVLVGVVALLTVLYKKLGALTSFMSLVYVLVEVYALYLLNIQLTAVVALVCAILLALFVISNVLVFTEVKRLTETGRTIQASIKEAYKNLIMTITDMHIVLVIVALLLTTVGAGEVAACGFISLIGVVASYVLYWFNRFMWFVTSSPEKDKFKFAGLKRVVYEDD